MASETTGRSRHINWDRDLCTTCQSCMVVCAERHTGISSLSQSRIWILADLWGGDYSAEYCRQCKNAPCAAACPEEAIRFDDQIRVWVVDDSLCAGCGECVAVCPFGAVKLGPVSGLAIKCDLCMGAAWCTKACPTNALTLRGMPEGDG